ncbi:hypothetical protein AXB88_22285 [Salmonella enterica]|nr:ParB/RepB/Spo0J family partition protein [Salmonella enterica]EBY7195081.1 hypothetical protein [Salmonella enterica subsp. enterica serovar Birkenhead]EDS4242081.1 ParB-like nuclease domain-containing protein [Salmonella enterica subsp. enterica]EAS1948313.1 hypothetical protein [Salmonella enterica]EAX1287053.1 hypothetical protein [Salmonella enterica]EAX2834714.1 hypothetical protein [Salmonella enterica]
MTIDELTELLRLYLSSCQTDDEKIQALNHIRCCLHRFSPLRDEPVDCVMWVRTDEILANDYNPNVMAPAEKRLLALSLEEDGFTQPVVVAAEKGRYRIVDGYHRYLLGRKVAGSEKKRQGYLPVTVIRPGREGKALRIAATIRHNRARGKHQVEPLSEIIRDLARQGWCADKIGTELGMDADEVLRLMQIGGLIELFADDIFSAAWTVR